jgi:hypothetical protein
MTIKFNCIDCIYKSKNYPNNVFCSLLNIEVYKGSARIDLTKFCPSPEKCPLKIEFDHQW